MAQASAGRVRLAGVVLLVVSVLLMGFGVWLTWIALSWDWPAWVPPQITLAPRGPAQPLAALRDTPVGLAAAFLLVFAGVAWLNGLWNVAFGRRNWLLVAPLLLLFVIFLLVGLWAGMQNSQG